MPMLAPKDVDRVVRFLVRRLKEFLRLVLALFGLGGAAFAAPQPAASADIPPPYTEEALTFTNGPITLSGTLTRPAGNGPFPAVVLLTGSGPQNRDEELMGFRPFRLIADHLARRGTVVLRYDDRGVGGSSGTISESTTEDFAIDALAAIEVLRRRTDVHPHRIGLLGHSEGAVAAAIAASRSTAPAFLVMLAGSAVRGDEILRRQLIDLSRQAGIEETALATILEAHAHVLTAVRMGAPDEDVMRAGRILARAQIEAAPEAQRKLIGDPEAFITNRLAAQLSQLTSPWMRFFVGFDPATALSTVSVPVLAIFGERDLQVAPDLNRPALERALAQAANRRVTITVYPHANHLFQTAKTGSPMEYAALEKQFVPGLLDDIATWIADQAR